MRLPLQVSLHGIASSDALQNAIRDKAAKLERYYEHIVSCRVVLALDGRHHRRGKRLSAHIDLKVPGGEIAVTREHDENPRIALREAFASARRKLADYAARRRGARPGVPTRRARIAGSPRRSARRRGAGTPRR